jgi:hypothetical protein
MLKPYSALDFICPICGVQPQERCKLLAGGERFESHLERKYIAKDHEPKKSLTKPPPARKKPKRG